MRVSLNLLLFLTLVVSHCKSNAQKANNPESKPSSEEGNAKVDPPSATTPFLVPVEPDPPLKLYKFFRQEDWNRVPEGFLSPTIFQVKVSSLKQNREEAILEADQVAKRKASRLLQKEASPNLSPESKVDIKILVEEYGKLIAESDIIEDKRMFVFHVKKPALEIIVKEKLK
jgi:hypothetical protein